MGNCTHKQGKNKLKLNLKNDNKNMKNNCQDIFEDLTPNRRNEQKQQIANKIGLKISKFNQTVQQNQEVSTGINCATTPNNKNKLEELIHEKTTASSINIKDNYKILKIIGEGSFGKVRLAQNQNGKRFAIKSILKSDANQRFYLLRRELEIMKKIDHPNLVKFYETYHDDKYLHIVMEYVEGVELSTFCEERFAAGRRFTEMEVAYIIRKLLSALAHMHSLNIIHRDLKPENIIINEATLDIKILDFGLSRDFSKGGYSNLQSIVGTPLYVAPEVIKEGPYNDKCDVWSIGILMFYLFSSQHAFQGCSIKDLFSNICIGKFSFSDRIWKDISQEAKLLITKLLTVDPEKRMTSEQALQDPYFTFLLKRQQNHKSRNMKKCLSKIQNVISFQNTHKFNMQTQSEEIEKLKMAFESIDINDNGFITASEMFKATQQLKINITMPQILQLFQEINANKNLANNNNANNLFSRKSDDLVDIRADEMAENQEIQKQEMENSSLNNRIHYSDFIFAAINLAKELDESKIKQIFDHFDKDNDNFISINDIENTLAQEGRKLPQILIKQMIEEVDTDNDCQISYPEFVHIIQTEIEIFQKTRTSFTNLEI